MNKLKARRNVKEATRALSRLMARKSKSLRTHRQRHGPTKCNFVLSRLKATGASNAKVIMVEEAPGEWKRITTDEKATVKLWSNGFYKTCSILAID